MTARSLGTSHEAYGSKFELRIIMLCSMAGTLMQALDSTIANVALPYMQGSLQASRDQITWVLTSYIVAAAIMTAPVGWLAARFGRKNLALICITGFTITSMMCGAAQNLNQMVIFRLAQGAFGAALSPLSQSIMLDLYPPEKRGSVMAIWGMGVMVGPILGPTLGGYLTDVYNWRWVFYINLPFGIAAVTGIWLFLRETHRDSTLKFDWLGFAFLGIALASLQLMLDRGTEKAWFESPEIIAEAVIAVLGAYLFFVQMFTTDRPFIPSALFKDRNFVSAMVLMFVTGLVMVASSALLPPYLQQLGGYSVTDTGILMAPRGVGTMIAMVIAGRIASRVDSRHIIAFGACLILWSMWEMSKWTPSVSAWSLVDVTFVQGLGMGLVFVPMNLVAFATLSAVFRTDGSAMINLMRNVGSAIGVSVTTTILANGTQTAHSALAAHASSFNRALSVGMQGMMWNPKIPMTAQMLNHVVDTNAQVIAYSNDFIFMLIVSIPSLFVVFFMKKPPTLAAGEKLEISE
jgi:DHA2 family multidrug resistance protein